MPGEAGFWVFVFGELFMFGCLFVAFAYVRTNDGEGFYAGQRTLSIPIGIANTFLLLTGSLFVVCGVRAARAGRNRATSAMMAAALVCGLGFVLNKVYEYTAAVRDGHFASINEFYGYYYLLTGIHLFHLIVSMVAIGVVWLRMRHRERSDRDQQALENAASFWHLVDLIWVVLFSLLYLSN